MADTDPAATLHALADDWRNSDDPVWVALAKHVEYVIRLDEYGENVEGLVRSLLAVAAAAEVTP